MQMAFVAFLYVLFFDLQPTVEPSGVSNHPIVLEDARIISKEMLDDHDDLEGEDSSTKGGNSTSKGPEKGVTEDEEGGPPEYEDSDSVAEQVTANELGDESDGEQEEEDKGGDVTMKDEVMRHDHGQTKARQDTKHANPMEGEEVKSHEKSSSYTAYQNNLPSCADEQIIKLMKELHTINPEGAVVRAIESENSRLCRKLSSGLATIEHFMATCDLSKGERVHKQLIHGVQSLNSKLCSEEIFRAEYLKYEDCYRSVGEDYRDCVGPAGWSEGNKEEYVCNEYIKVANCFYIKTAVRCSTHEARVVKDLVKEVVGNVLMVQCKDIEKEPDVSRFKNRATSEKCYSQGLLQLVFTLWTIRNFLPFLGGIKP